MGVLLLLGPCCLFPPVSNTNAKLGNLPPGLIQKGLWRRGKTKYLCNLGEFFRADCELLR